VGNLSYCPEPFDRPRGAWQRAGTIAWFARTLGITIPPKLLIQATELIE
jgi:hypothetical protein